MESIHRGLALSRSFFFFSSGRCCKQWAGEELLRQLMRGSFSLVLSPPSPERWGTWWPQVDLSLQAQGSLVHEPGHQAVLDVFIRGPANRERRSGGGRAGGEGRRSHTWKVQPLALEKVQLGGQPVPWKKTLETAAQRCWP